MTHLVWDWNGTLLDDLALTIEATNASLAVVGGPAVTVEEHRRSFRRPLVEYYSTVLGRPVLMSEFELLDRAFHQTYRTGLHACELATDALAALAAWEGTQSLLSMWSHAELIPELRRRGLVERLVRIDGRRGYPHGDLKGGYLARHLDALGLDGAGCVLIGDSVDDADAAAVVGAGCVLYAGGITDAELLQATGYPVAETLLEAVALAADGSGRRPAPALRGAGG